MKNGFHYPTSRDDSSVPEEISFADNDPVSALATLPPPPIQRPQYHRAPVAAEPQGREPPHSIETEKSYLGCCLLFGSETLAGSNLDPAAFYSPAHRTIYGRLLDMLAEGKQVETVTLFQELKERGELDEVGGYDYLGELETCAPSTTLHAGEIADKIRDLAARRSSLRLAQEIAEAANDTSQDLESIVSRARVSLNAMAAGNNRDALRDRALAAEVDPANPPPPDDPVFYVAGKLCSTSGNLSSLVSRAKTGKTAIIGAHVTACLVADGVGNAGADTLGVRSEPPKGKAVVVIDTEQSPHHAAKLIERAMTRAGLPVENRPKWLRLFPLAGWQARDLATVLPSLMAKMAKDHGGIHVLFIDGGADFALNVNDPEEAAKLCAQWHALAIEHQCAVVVVIHSNEGEKSDDVARGWLGKQLRRKSESNLQIKKSGDVAVLFSETGQRHAPIMEKEGPRFTWSDEAGMHVSCASEGVERTGIEADELRELAAEIFGTDTRLKWADIVEKVKTARMVSKVTAERRHARMKKTGIIKQVGMGFWELSAP